jgi:hypothetical protein
MTLPQLLEQFEKEFVTTDKEFGQRYTNGTPTMQIDWLRTHISEMVVEAARKATEDMPRSDDEAGDAIDNMLRILCIKV